ncbi:hypothetical protein VNI00_010485 [Paramarasmius palmivorus]|uniref:Uncharacterized protein n=1 Tax=Paramarasmius palmivorus TaxID=297713 RepID=A0AAW0CIL0_9AGAR
MRIFKQPSVSAYPYAATAHFDVGYHTIEQAQPRTRSSWIGTSRPSEPQSHFHFPGSNSNPVLPRPSEHHRPKTSSFSIYPGASKDMFIYEASNSEFSSSSTSLVPLPFSPALSSDSTATVRSPDSPVDALPPHSFNRSSTPAPPKGGTFPLHIPALAQAQSGLRNVVSSDSSQQSSHSSQTSHIATQPSSGPADIRPFPAMETSETELDRISRLNTEINAGYNHLPVNNSHPAISIEPRTAPPQIYRDIPLRSSPDPFDAAFAVANAARNTADTASATHPLPIPPVLPSDTEQIRDQRGAGSINRRNSYLPPAQLAPSISQSTTSTLDPNHPLLVAPGSMTSTSQNVVQMGVLRSGNGSAESENIVVTQRSSPPGKYSRSRTDSTSRQSNSPPVIFPTSIPVSSMPIATGLEVSPQQHRVEPSIPVMSQHQITPPPAQPPSTVTMPVAQPSVPLLHIAHIPASTPAQPAVADAPLPVRSRTVSIETVSESSSERSGGSRSPMTGIIQQIIPPPAPAPVPDVPRRSRRTMPPPTTATMGRPHTSPPQTSPPTAYQSTNTSKGRPSLPALQTNASSAPSTTVKTSTVRSNPPALQASPSIATSSTTTEPFITPVAAAPPVTMSQGSSAPTRSKTPGPKRSHSDGDNPVYAGASQRSATPFKSEFVPNMSAPRPPIPEPQRRFTDNDQHLVNARGPVVNVSATSTATRATHTVRWKQELICPSPILPSQRRKGWFNRRGDQLWTNSGSYKPPPAGQEFPLELASYPDYGEGWMNEDGVKIDMMHRLIPKPPINWAFAVYD